MSATAPRRRVRSTNRTRSIPHALALLPLVLLRLVGRRIHRVFAASPRLRSAGVRVAIAVAISMVIAGAVGVILLNNVVITRTAELGELDTKRREISRENTLLATQAAEMQAPHRVSRIAKHKLGMVPSPEMPTFIFLDPESSALTPYQRKVRAAQHQSQAKKQEGAP